VRLVTSLTGFARDDEAFRWGNEPMIIAATLLNATGMCATFYLASMVVQAFRGATRRSAVIAADRPVQ